MAVNNRQPRQWQRPTLFAAGAVALARAVIALYDPDYWSPRTPLDYAAVVGTSLLFLLLAAGLWGFLQQHHRSGRAGLVFRNAVIITCAAAATIGMSNFVEDILRVDGLGTIWVAGIMAVSAGLVVSGISALWVHDFPRLVGGLLLACAVGLFLMVSGGLFLVGLALFTLAAKNKWRSVQVPHIQTDSKNSRLDNRINKM